MGSDLTESPFPLASVSSYALVPDHSYCFPLRLALASPFGIWGGSSFVPFGDCRRDGLYLARSTPFSGVSGHEGRLGFCLQPDVGC